MRTIAFTCGDINGIGPEICLKAINQIFDPRERKLILFCPSAVFEQASISIDKSFSYRIVKKYSPD